ncbi:MAG: histidine--tRNA ligase [Parcubacteria group bacterium]|nr:histidine--tRNA ligase [Parcubacteria group bacterium]
MARQLFQTPTGMHDILPEDLPYWEKIREDVFDMARFYDFGYVETPILEAQGVFEKGLGLASDVVEKEMFTLKTKGGDELALRPEGTAPIMRAYLQHGWESLPQPAKVFYWGPMFRHENPQAGRFRQFHQFGFEMLGSEDPVLDAQLIQMALNLLSDLGVKNLICEVNSLGDKDCRIKYRSALKDYFRNHIKKMCSDCQNRFKVNPLRILDCKEEKCREVIAKAPQVLDFICDDCRTHFKKLLEFLGEIDVPYMLNPHLVRGLDYYAKTVFEIYSSTPSLDSTDSTPDTPGTNAEEKRPAQAALASGGRYDGLAEMLGGKNVPAVGFAAGIERIIGAMKESKARVALRPQPKLFLVQLGDLAKKKSLKILEEFRKNNIPIAESLGKHSIKTQMKLADKLEVKLTLIFGQKEALDNEMIVRDMTSGVQETVPLAKLIAEVKKRLKG